MAETASDLEGDKHNYVLAHFMSSSPPPCTLLLGELDARCDRRAISQLAAFSPLL